jgi:hypothetical protein
MPAPIGVVSAGVTGAFAALLAAGAKGLFAAAASTL